jgi:hypothetical protein
MKRIILILLVVVLISAGFVPVFAVDKPPGNKVIAYYFHGNFRCPTCIMMEKYSREAIGTNLKGALDSGELEFKAVNVDERANEHFIKDYKLYTKSLILSLVKDGNEIKSKNLDRIWEYVRNKEKFIAYVTSEVSNFLREAQ